VPGLNAAIKSLVWRLSDSGCEIVGLRRGWAALLNVIPEKGFDNSLWITPLDRSNTRTIDRTGGTMLHSSRTNPALLKPAQVPEHLRGDVRELSARGRYDLTAVAVRSLQFLELDALIAIGGDGTLSFARRLDSKGFRSWPSPRPWITTYSERTTA